MSSVSRLAQYAGLLAALAVTAAASPGTGGVSFGCDAGDAALCDAIFAALDERLAKGMPLRRAGPDGSVPRPGEIAVTFVLDRRDAQGVSGHIDWQDGPEGPIRSGPVLALDVMDAELAPSMYPGFARSLLQVDADLAVALDFTPRP